MTIMELSLDLPISTVLDVDITMNNTRLDTRGSKVSVNIHMNSLRQFGVIYREKQ
jgi:hypothetical protein